MKVAAAVTVIQLCGCLVLYTTLLTSCVVGGGPLVGYGERGWFAGGEVSAGGEIVLPQATLGFQSDQHLLYLRADEALDATAMQRPGGAAPDDGLFVPGARIGGGIGWDMAHNDAPPYGVFMVGASLGHALGHLNGCGAETTIGVVELQLRYAAGWSVVLNPRVERGTTFCN